MNLAMKTIVDSEDFAAYCAVGSSRVSDEDARIVAPAFVELAKENRLVPEQIVKEAETDERLRKHFTWDDSVAAHRYRITEAYYLIRSIAIEVDGDDGKEKLRAFHMVEPEVEDGVENPDGDTPRRMYMPVSVVESRLDYIEQIMQRARTEMETFIGKYSRYSRQIRDRDPDLADAIDFVGETKRNEDS